MLNVKHYLHACVKKKISKHIFHVVFEKRNFEFLKLNFWLQKKSSRLPSIQVGLAKRAPIRPTRKTINKTLDLLFQASFELSQEDNFWVPKWRTRRTKRKRRRMNFVYISLSWFDITRVKYLFATHTSGYILDIQQNFWASHNSDIGKSTTSLWTRLFAWLKGSLIRFDLAILLVNLTLYMIRCIFVELKNFSNKKGVGFPPMWVFPG